MTALRFLRGWGIYNAGEIASFGPDDVGALTAAGIAEPAFAEVEVSADADEAMPAVAPPAAAPRRTRKK